MKFKASELRPRWDGLMVCKDDWEIRHPLDFFRNRNDQHKLPWIRSNDGADPRLSYTPTLSNVSATLYDAEVAPTSFTGYYFQDALNLVTTVVIDYQFQKPTASDATIKCVPMQAGSWTVGTSATVTLPTTPTLAGSFTVINDRGTLIKSGTVPASSATLTLGTWARAEGSFTISIRYGT